MKKKQKLIFIGGPPGVGKTTVARLVLGELNHSIRVDGDELWFHMNPWLVNDITNTMAIKNIRAVLNNFLDAGFTYVILSWVLHLNEIVDDILSGLKNRDFEFHFVTLICDENSLGLRLANDGRGPLNDGAKERLNQCKALTARVIDTTGKSAMDTAGEIANVIR